MRRYAPSLPAPRRYGLRAVILCLFFSTLTSAFAQRQLIDEEVLSDLVIAKQDEVKKRFMRNLVYRGIRTTDNTTYNTMYDLVDVLLTEKNATRMTEAITHKCADYGVTYLATWYFMKRKGGAVLETAMGRDTILPHPYNRLRKAYADEREKRDSKAEPVRIDGDTKFIVGYKSWLMDSLYWAFRGLAEDTSFAERRAFNHMGLFLVDREHEWQTLYGPDYAAFWKAYDKDGLKDRLKASIVQLVKEVAQGSVKLCELGAAVGLDEAENCQALNALDLSTLAATTNGEQVQALARLNPATALHEDTVRALLVDSLQVLHTYAVKAFDNKETPRAKGANGNPNVKVVFDMLMKAVELYRQEVGQNNLVCRIADVISKYVILDPEKADPLSRFGFSIDVEAIILNFEDRIVALSNSPVRNNVLARVPLLRSKFSPFTYIGLNARPFFTIGINYGFFSGLDSAFSSESVLGDIKQVAFAAEKIGVKWRWADWKYTHAQPKGEWFKYHGRFYRRDVRPRDPLFSNMYVMAYGSGLLYTIADLRSEKTFRYPIAGVGAGVTMFNGLELSASYAVPIVAGATLKEDVNAGFWNASFDIPIFDYIRAARDKRAK